MQVSILMVRALAGVIERSGASRERFLREAGIERAWLDEGTMRLSMIAYVRAMDAALTVSGDPAFGLHMGEQARAAMFDVLGSLSEYAGTLRESVATMERYARLMAEDNAPELHELGEAAVVRFPSLKGNWPAVRLTAEFAMAAFLSSLELFVGSGARPSEVRFAYPEPPYGGEYQRVFGGLARFDCDATEVLFPAAWLDRTQPYGSPELYAMLKEQAERSLDRLDRDASLRERVEQVLARRALQPTSMDEVAREVGMSARSLRRRLQSEGLSYSDLVTRSRMHVAKRSLERPGASIQEIAYQMGFASPAAFHRAFKRWTGLTPKEYQDSF